jgi:hypothetical protein
MGNSSTSRLPKDLALLPGEQFRVEKKGKLKVQIGRDFHHQKTPGSLEDLLKMPSWPLVFLSAINKSKIQLIKS